RHRRVSPSLATANMRSNRPNFGEYPRTAAGLTQNRTAQYSPPDLHVHPRAVCAEKDGLISSGPAMISATENNTTGSITATVWVGFAMMCIGMFMAILDVQVVATSLATIQEALNIVQDQMSWIQTSYLIAEIIAIPLTGFLTRLLS